MNAVGFTTPGGQGSGRGGGRVHTCAVEPARCTNTDTRPYQKKRFLLRKVFILFSVEYFGALAAG